MKSALLSYHVASIDNQGLESITEKDMPYDQEELISFQEILSRKDPTRDLSTIEILVEDERSKSFLHDAKTDFSLYKWSEKNDKEYVNWTMSCPKMRKQLKIEF